eukprot:TRINITY_DN3063_c0_g1_i1.p2 TRINITY_DN3063_c0_g1~~TRINITY_DN3063_c0_g1_i1.p2  ORF type:complete len:397 (+),score=94.92 TRINITY_DN3063_c0_g1_i1:601-1791(+)
MRQRIESGVLTKSVLSQWAGDLMYDLFAHAPPSEAARQQLEYVFTCLYDRLKADFDGNRKADWEPLGQDVKAFFEAGFRVRKHVRPAAQQTIFLRYVDVLNLFLALPAEPPADLESIPGCWLRPTLALAAGMRPGNFQLQDHIVPESLAPSDLLVDLFWDLEVDLFCRSPEDPVDEITAVRRKRGATKVVLSILQNCDFSTMRPDESGKKSPPVVVICHAKSMVLKLADTLNHLARYEYASGYRGAEAAYRDTEGLSTMAVSILVCTPGRMLNELSSGGLSMANTKLLAFTVPRGALPPRVREGPDARPGDRPCDALPVHQVPREGCRRRLCPGPQEHAGASVLGGVGQGPLPGGGVPSLLHHSPREAEGAQGRPGPEDPRRCADDPGLRLRGRGA